MRKIKLGILKKGDSVLFVSDKMLAVKRVNGEVDLFSIARDEENDLPRIDTSNIVTVTYGENTIETIIDGENGDFSITTF